MVVGICSHGSIPETCCGQHDDVCDCLQCDWVGFMNWPIDPQWALSRDAEEKASRSL